MLQLPKRPKWIALLILGLLLMVATIPAAVWLTHTTTAQLENTRRRCQDMSGKVHQVIIKDSRVQPQHTLAKRCDRLKITNLDSYARLIALGPHDHHVSYDGISERLLQPGQSLNLKLGSVASLGFHDHQNEAVHGDFTVSYN